METKVSPYRAQQIVQSLNIPNYIEILWKGFSRGTWFLCFDKVTFQLDILHSHNRFIHYKIQDKV